MYSFFITLELKRVLASFCIWSKTCKRMVVCFLFSRVDIVPGKVVWCLCSCFYILLSRDFSDRCNGSFATITFFGLFKASVDLVDVSKSDVYNEKLERVHKLLLLLQVKWSCDLVLVCKSDDLYHHWSWSVGSKLLEVWNGWNEEMLWGALRDSTVF